MKDNTGILCLQLSGLSLMTMIVVKNAGQPFQSFFFVNLHDLDRLINGIN